MRYVIKVGSEKICESLMKELEEKGWSWQSGHNPTNKIMGLATIVNRYLVLDTDYYCIRVSSKKSLEKDDIKIKDLSCIPEPMSFIVKSENKKQFKSILRHLAVRGYKWVAGTEILKDFSLDELSLRKKESWRAVEGLTWIRVNRESKEVSWTSDQSVRDEWESTKSVDIEKFDLTFVQYDGLHIKFKSWKTFKKAMKILEKEDFLWLDGQKPTEWEYKAWDKKDFLLNLIIWKKRDNGYSKRLTWERL